MSVKIAGLMTMKIDTPGPGHKTFAVTPLRSARSLGHLQRSVGLSVLTGAWGVRSVWRMYIPNCALPTRGYLCNHALPAAAVAVTCRVHIDHPGLWLYVFPSRVLVVQIVHYGVLGAQVWISGSGVLSRMVALLGTGYP